MVPFSSPTSSTSAKSSQWSMMICCNGDAFGRGMARADMDTGNQLFVAPSRTARASSSHSWSKRSRCGCLPRQPGRFSLPALPKACARLFAASHLSHLTHRFSVWREAPLSKKRRVPRQVLGPLCTNQCQGSRPDVRSGRPAAYEQGRRQHLWVGVYRPTPATSMYETSRLWAIGVLFQLEQAIVVRRQQPALHAAQPAREGTNWYADPGFGGEPVGGFALAERCHA